jgi:uncharacterized glyoxalase superfamily protein PhnB
MLGSATDTEFGRFMEMPDAIGGKETQAPYVIVRDVDAHYEHAKESGAKIVLDIADQDYGGRLYSCHDIEGHLWSFGSYDPWVKQPS